MGVPYFPGCQITSEIMSHEIALRWLLLTCQQIRHHLLTERTWRGEVVCILVEFVREMCGGEREVCGGERGGRHTYFAFGQKTLTRLLGWRCFLCSE